MCPKMLGRVINTQKCLSGRFNNSMNSKYTVLWYDNLTHSKRNHSSQSANKQTFFEKYLGPSAIVAPETFKSRWVMAGPAILTHLCIGAPYGWSAIASHLSKEHGFVCSASSDWTLAEVSLPMSVVFCLHGLSAALLGKWQMKVGPRVSIGLAGLCFGGGFALSGLGAHLHNLPLIYMGFGVLSGTGLGLAYTPPIQCLMDWFPDKKGVASGLTIMGFGSGSMILVPSVNYLIAKFAKIPTYLGQKIENVMQDGKLFTSLSDGSLAEVVYANASDLAKLSHKGLQEGYYLVGSGSTGCTATLLALGTAYTAALLSAAALIKTPHPTYIQDMKTKVASLTPGGNSTALVQRNVHVDTVMKTPQFYGLAATLLCLGSGGMGLLSVCKPLMSDTFGTLLPDIVTAGFASTYILILSFGNLSGRIAWGVLSDYTGRRAVFHMFTFGSLGLYLSLPYLVSQIVQTKAALPLALFCGGTCVTLSFMGGCYAILPAYEADLFGAKYVGANHGRMLLASSAAAILGPSMILTLRNIGERSAINGLLQHIDASTFQQKFGASINEAQQLIEAKTLTISKLMEVMPSHVQDPTPFMYNTSFYSIAGLMGIAAMAHYMVSPVNQKYFEKDEPLKAEILEDK